ncbi:hypothetical protein [Tuwongella immobilis]|uniref:Lipoprotein n=1 Tax=Tuwongella immobilis TaxID=692036 RepID=A0A6C2YT18_9BACT|nr:hypothetical protein [Tuwongella immobilis]VIP04477.1 Uncultured bacterium genome assembly Metasoil_fosmids_resub OS=uncultured bacterium PE=4 SV=1 [Tuwongella immobilis]VTS06316.1 Uncultured bacterium genome assembly Metasoil_fosmids_resub OS=uncultured bacterium PE=4 SV=1 [Tuwongella immobilis]
MLGLRKKLFLLIACLAPLGASGCFPPFGGLVPVPVQPWATKELEDKYLHKNDRRTPIMPPVNEAFPPRCEDAPSDAEVIRTLPKIARGVPYLYEEFRDDIQIVKERLVDKIDPPRFFPLVGMAQLHHCHWKCTVYWTETVQTDYPFPMKLKKRRVEVLYIDKDHLHQYVGPDPDLQRKVTREYTGY